MILLLETVHEDALEILQQADDVVLASDPTRIDDHIDRRAVRAVVTRGMGRVDAATLGTLPNNTVVGRCGAGLDNIDVGWAEERGIAVVHTPGRTTAAVAEHALMLMLALSRRLVELSLAVRGGDWEARAAYVGREMRGKRLGVVGLGAIGQRVAEFGRCLGMDVVCTTSRTDTLAVPRVELEELLMTSDVVQLCTSLRPESRHLLGASEMMLLSDTAIVVNIARGGLVDHDALASALCEDRFAGYAADVWRDDAPASSSDMSSDPRVLVTPHVAALTDITYREICVQAAVAVVAVLGGAEPDPGTIRVPPQRRRNGESHA